MAETRELSCGACGGSDFKLKCTYDSEGSEMDLSVLCKGCGSITHVLPTPPRLRIAWGRSAEGEKDDGVLCPLPWRTHGTG